MSKRPSKKAKAKQSKPIRDGPYGSSDEPPTAARPGYSTALVANAKSVVTFAEFVEKKVQEKYEVGTKEHSVIRIATDDPSWNDLNNLSESSKVPVPRILMSFMKWREPDLVKIKGEDPQLYSVLLLTQRDSSERKVAAENVADYIEGTLLPQWQYPHLLDGAVSSASLQSLIDSWFLLGCFTKWRTLTSIISDTRSIYDKISECAQHPVLWDSNSGEAAYNSFMTHVLKRLEDIGKASSSVVNDDVGRFSFAVWPSCGHEGSVHSAVDTLCAFSAKPNLSIYNRSFNEETLVTIVEYKWNVLLGPSNRAKYIGQGLQYAARYLDRTPHQPAASNTDHVSQLRVLVACVVQGEHGEIAMSMNKAVLDFRKNGNHQIIIDPKNYQVDKEGFTKALVEKWDVGESVGPIEGVITPR